MQRLGFRTTVVNGDGDPEKKNSDVLPGIEALDDADLAIFYMRFLRLPEKEWKPIERYIQSGKPVIGLRTANHAFRFPDSDPRSQWNDGFGRRVLGSPYIAHQSTKTNVSIVQKYSEHSILSGLKKARWESFAKLYLTRLEPGCVPLMIGEGEGRQRILEKPFGTVQVNQSETDIVPGHGRTNGDRECSPLHLAMQGISQSHRLPECWSMESIGLWKRRRPMI